MGRVFDEFRTRFRGQEPEPKNVRRDEEIASEKAEKDASVRDMRNFVGCLAYREFRRRIEAEIAENEPVPEHGSDVSMCRTFKQAGLRTALRDLDEMVRLAEEKLADD